MKRIEKIRCDNMSDGRITLKFKENYFGKTYLFSYHPFQEKTESVIWCTVYKNDHTDECLRYKFIVHYSRHIQHERCTITGRRNIVRWFFNAEMKDSNSYQMYEITSRTTYKSYKSIKSSLVCESLAKYWIEKEITRVLYQKNGIYV